MQIDNIIKEFKESLENAKAVKTHHTALIIASSFSMMILLLTFIKERSIILEIGIGALLISILLEYVLYNQNIGVNIYQFPKKSQIQKHSKLLKKTIFPYFFGEFSFFIGIVFILFFFNLSILSYLVILYLLCTNLKRLKASINTLKHPFLKNNIPNLENDLIKIFKKEFGSIAKLIIIANLIQIIINIIVIVSTFNHLYLLVFIT